MASSVATHLECHDQALLQCILNELKLKGACCSSKYATKRNRLSPGKCSMEEETRSPSAASATPASPRSCRSTSPASCRSNVSNSGPVPLTLNELLPAMPVTPSPATPASVETGSCVASWCVVNPNAKFKASCGFPLVSPQLSTAVLDDFRVIFAPGSAWALAQSKGTKKQKEMASNKAAPLYGSLQIKFLSDDPIVRRLKLYFTIGSMRLGPFRTSPERSTSELCELPLDWKRLVDKADTTFVVKVEMNA
mmetsp:Transcript_43742/g.81621  ORF Transcript_43742/g.81621 Transcript_43742/m.81621 type:complete len:251 (-) Transcript_43742:219-971(-)